MPGTVPGTAAEWGARRKREHCLGEDILLEVADGKERNRPAHSRMTAGAASTGEVKQKKGRDTIEVALFDPVD